MYADADEFIKLIGDKYNRSLPGISPEKRKMLAKPSTVLLLRWLRLQASPEAVAVALGLGWVALANGAAWFQGPKRSEAPAAQGPKPPTTAQPSPDRRTLTGAL